MQAIEGSELPAEIQDWLGRIIVEQRDGVVAEAGAFRLFAAAVEDCNPLHWNEDKAGQIAGSLVAPAALISAWNRPDPWQPDGKPPSRSMELHFSLKESLDLPMAVVTASETELHEPVRPGDRLYAQQRLDSVGPLTRNRLGQGRYWTISVLYHRESDDALCGIESLSFFGYREEAA